jgi:hypothetical protein
MAQPRFRVVVRPGKNKVVVRPPFETVTKATTNAFRVVNKTSARIWVFMPAGVLDQTNNGVPDPVEVFPIKAGGHQDFTTFATTVDGAYSFPIFCEETFSFAKGNSDPEFIVG